MGDHGDVPSVVMDRVRRTVMKLRPAVRNWTAAKSRRRLLVWIGAALAVLAVSAVTLTLALAPISANVPGAGEYGSAITDQASSETGTDG